jgi:hypothetical protein
MTPRQQLVEQFKKLLGDGDPQPTALELVKVKLRFTSVLVEAIQIAPCDHAGMRWDVFDGGERCGVCGRRYRISQPEKSFSSQF